MIYAVNPDRVSTWYDYGSNGREREVSDPAVHVFACCRHYCGCTAFLCVHGHSLFLWTYSSGAIWSALALAGIWRFRSRGLWLLVGAPFVAFWPVAFELLARACAANPNACPWQCKL